MGLCFSNNNFENNDELKKATSECNLYSLNGQAMFGKVVYVYDGDTIHIVFNINNTLVKYICRLNGIDTPEICPKNINNIDKRNAEIESAKKSRTFLLNSVTNVSHNMKHSTKAEIKLYCNQSNKLIWVKCYKFDKYGRLLVDCYQDNMTNQSINMMMIDLKYATSYDGGTKDKYNDNMFN